MNQSESSLFLAWNIYHEYTHDIMIVRDKDDEKKKIKWINQSKKKTNEIVGNLLYIDYWYIIMTLINYIQSQFTGVRNSV